MSELDDTDGTGNEDVEMCDWDLIATHNQGIWKTHGVDACRGTVCVVHAPSEHHMRDWPLGFSAATTSYGQVLLGTRTCEHGVVHPDPDSLAYLRDVTHQLSPAVFGHTGCDGCCVPPPTPLPRGRQW